ncbi:MAG: hypothetical protein M3Q70_02040 [bacterium]|nr:hypothetical protein [bacterium]
MTEKQKPLPATDINPTTGLSSEVGFSPEGANLGRIGLSGPNRTPKYIDVMAPPTDEEVKRAAQFGFDLLASEKYFAPEIWLNRNNIAKTPTKDLRSGNQ